MLYLFTTMEDVQLSKHALLPRFIYLPTTVGIEYFFFGRYSPILTSEGLQVRRVYDVARGMEIRLKYR